jgi:hypothetical protein
MTRSLLLSLLSRQCLLLKESGFRERYPNGWLIWESGAWNLPEIGEEMGRTRLPARDMADCLPESDVLCFELAPVDRELLLGRSTENDIVINDATVSRAHLRLGVDDGRWWVQACPDSAESLLNGTPLDADQRTTLADGEQVQVGDVTLTYLDVDSFISRVETQAQRLAAMAGPEAELDDESTADHLG